MKRKKKQFSLPAPKNRPKKSVLRRRIPMNQVSWGIMTVDVAVVIVLMGRIAALTMNDWMPSGRDVVQKNQSRNQLRQSWMDEQYQGVTLSLFPYDTHRGAKLDSPNEEALQAMQFGRDMLSNFCRDILIQWNSSGSINYDVKYDSLDAVDIYQFLPKSVKNPQQYSMDDPLYIGILQATPRPGTPSNWLLYRLPVTHIVAKGRDKISMHVDAVFHPSQGLVSLIIKQDGNTWPTSWREMSESMPIDYIRTQSNEFINRLASLYGKDQSLLMQYNKSYFDLIVPRKGEISLPFTTPAPTAASADNWSANNSNEFPFMDGLNTDEPMAYYTGDLMCVIAYGYYNGDKLLVYMDLKTMHVVGYSRQYATAIP